MQSQATIAVSSLETNAQVSAGGVRYAHRSYRILTVVVDAGQSRRRSLLLLVVLKWVSARRNRVQDARMSFGRLAGI